VLYCGDGFWSIGIDEDPQRVPIYRNELIIQASVTPEWILSNSDLVHHVRAQKAIDLARRCPLLQ
jgi:hypothetical protein